MPKAKKQKFYAVRNGRQGPKIYTSWEEVKENTSRFPGASHKSFLAESEAYEWLSVAPVHTMTHTDPTDDTQASSGNPCKATPSLKIRIKRPAPPQPQPELPRPPQKPEIELSPEQADVLSRVKIGQSVFFTGSAGTGKSVLLREIIAHCRERSAVAVTAATGIASVHIGGQTLHSWAGIGLGKEPAETLVGKLLGQDKYQRRKEKSGESSGKKLRVVQKWKIVKTLIIDEISMIDGRLFDKLEFIGRALRENDQPFGGIQLVISGDFCQLPPVPDQKDGAQVAATFAFEAESWTRCVGKPVMLTRVFRQREQAFIDMLNDMRYGLLSPEAISKFTSLSRKVKYDDGIEPTELFPTRLEVHEANAKRLGELPGQSITYSSLDLPKLDENGNLIPQLRMEKLLDQLVAPKNITLKVGAQVMLIKNLVQGELVNGSVGRVIGFSSTKDALEDDDMQIALFEDKKEQNGSEGEMKLKPIKDVRDRISKELLNTTRLWPKVQFRSSTVLCVPAEFDVVNATGHVEAVRRQVPLILAWALSIHKSQGQTLERVRVDLRRTFEKGQAYVALSRATSMETLEVRNFDPQKVQAHPRVLEWIKETTGKDYRMQEQMDEDEYWSMV